MKLKKKIIFIIIFIILVIVGYDTLVKQFSKNENDINHPEFFVKTMELYSSANAISNTTNYQNPEWNISIFQYTDIAIYIDRLNKNNDNNYITQLYIDNVIIDNPKIQSKLFYLNPLEFGNGKLLTENLIEKRLDYNIVNSENNENEFSYNIPIFFEDCSNPITFRYIDSILNNYTLDNSQNLKYDGSILKIANVDLQNLKNSISMDLNIVTKDNVTHKQKICFDIPLESENKSIYEGSIEVNQKIDKTEF